jgi:hypothetical protein
MSTMGHDHGILYFIRSLSSMKGNSGESRLLLTCFHARALTVLTECTILVEFVYIRILYLYVVWVSKVYVIACLSWLSLGFFGCLYMGTRSRLAH